MWPWEGRGPWECKADFSDTGLRVEETEADGSGGTNGTSPCGLGPAGPSLPLSQSSQNSCLVIRLAG